MVLPLVQRKLSVSLLSNLAHITVMIMAQAKRTGCPLAISHLCPCGRPGAPLVWRQWYQPSTPSALRRTPVLALCHNVADHVSQLHGEGWFFLYHRQCLFCTKQYLAVDRLYFSNKYWRILYIR
jgi:hypothetical protein